MYITNPIKSHIYSRPLDIHLTTNNFEIKTFLLDIGRVKYSLKVPLEYSPDIISDGIIVDKNGIWVINTAMIMYVAKYPLIKEPTKKKESDNWP